MGMRMLYTSTKLILPMSCRSCAYLSKSTPLRSILVTITPPSNGIPTSQPMAAWGSLFAPACCNNRGCTELKQRKAPAIARRHTLCRGSQPQAHTRRCQKRRMLVPVATIVSSRTTTITVCNHYCLLNDTLCGSGWSSALTWAPFALASLSRSNCRECLELATLRKANNSSTVVRGDRLIRQH